MHKGIGKSLLLFFMKSKPLFGEKVLENIVFCKKYSSLLQALTNNWEARRVFTLLLKESSIEWWWSLLNIWKIWCSCFKNFQALFFVLWYWIIMKKYKVQCRSGGQGGGNFANAFAMQMFLNLLQKICNCKWKYFSTLKSAKVFVNISSVSAQITQQIAPNQRRGQGNLPESTLASSIFL